MEPVGGRLRCPFYKQASGQLFKDDVNGFSSTSDICLIAIKLEKIWQVITGLYELHKYIIKNNFFNTYDEKKTVQYRKYRVCVVPNNFLKNLTH